MLHRCVRKKHPGISFSYSQSKQNRDNKKNINLMDRITSVEPERRPTSRFPVCKKTKIGVGAVKKDVFLKVDFTDFDQIFIKFER